MQIRSYVAWIISIIATLGSLYFSEVRNFIPCTLCWYQRILMYPLVIILGISILKKDKNSSIYVLPFSIIGFFLAFYHYLTQKFTFFQSIEACEIGIPCTTIYINWLGFITIPLLSCLAFLTISILVILNLRKK
ncbi:disulfide oxidoreductase [Heyndrickxia oleronia]|uniref:Probable disulfide formation protein n=1 Tax=Heyndrickxia oleronia TaxID=38875 RepID=A0AAW6T6L2_9BACI|nr:disulfide oxidoreductase [Heyndrickxia oleronia]NYV66475.1 disulfide bond formation protein B [Bacillus sp. Gen3]MCM3240759.1 disulfide oxidoreductase [Heyndrickxia oleronia]MCM3454811.1 disulfide oxidoreductase [Heyndrickxia oleronia]MDH5164476.1 disulfide oxidoreductase [Heyndrickxia oleronia]GIN41468.1 disulfide bond formation protein C [Heyndrickxia oleronia]